MKKEMIRRCMVCYSIKFEGKYLALREYDHEEMFGESSKYEHSDTWLSVNCFKKHLGNQMDKNSLNDILESLEEKLIERCPE
jgi:hypothetical protein